MCVHVCYTQVLYYTPLASLNALYSVFPTTFGRKAKRKESFRAYRMNELGAQPLHA